MLRTVLLTGLALCAFAANSLLCRLALAPGGMPAGAHIDSAACN